MRPCPAAVLLAALAACGGGGGGGGRPSAAEVAAYAGNLFDAHAAALVRCQDAVPAYAQAVVGGMIMTRADTVARSEQVYGRGKVRFDPASGAQCIGDLNAAQTCWDVALARTDPAGPCRHALTGTVALGGTCLTNSECADGRCDASATCPAVCVPRAVAGDACSLGGDCANGHACFYPSPYPSQTTGTCARNDLGEGAPCGSLAAGYCRTDLACRPPPGGGEAICTATRPLGASCADDPFSCATNGYCDGASCVARRHVGDTCALPQLCQAGSYCSSDTGTCIAFGGVGAPCGAVPGGYAPCLGAWCPIGNAAESATCLALEPYGAACTASERCKAVVTCNAATSPCVEPCL